MKNYLYNYIEYVDKLLDDDSFDTSKIINEHLIKIKFFQHERLIHLIVTLFYALFMIIFFMVSCLFMGFLIIGFILMIFLIFYVIHYFKLENGVQYLYKQYDKIKEKNKR